MSVKRKRKLQFVLWSSADAEVARVRRSCMAWPDEKPHRVETYRTKNKLDSTMAF